MDISNLIASLERGICPAELNYKPQEVTEIDWDKLLYNLKYHDPAFYDKKFPEEIKKLPAYDKIIDLIVEKNEDNSPLKEMDSRNNVDKDYTNEVVHAE